MSDHSYVKLEIMDTELPKRRDFWKIDNELVTHPEFYQTKENYVKML